MTTPQKTHGFTLIELMITVVIISIIAAVAYPMYTEYVRQARRSDAQIALTTVANAQERFYQDCNTYAATISSASGCGNGLGFTSSNSPDGFYTLTVPLANTASYQITATATGIQAADTQCATLSLSSTGAKTSTGGGVCW